MNNMYTVTTTFGDYQINYIIVKWNKYYTSVHRGVDLAEPLNQ
jgi:hypothetical protein